MNMKRVVEPPAVLEILVRGSSWPVT